MKLGPGRSYFLAFLIFVHVSPSIRLVDAKESEEGKIKEVPSLNLNPNLASVSEGADKDTSGSIPVGGNPNFEDVFIEENPDYISVDDEISETEASTDDDDDDDTTDEADDDAKTKVSKTLQSRKSRSKTPLALMKKNRGKITLVLTIFAFRNELFQLLAKITKRHAPKDAVTGVLKLLLFVNFMRRIQTGGKDTTAIVRMIGQASPILGALIDKTMNYNPAYVPPICQHFAFESLNEYYLKDGMALQKAILTRNEGLKWPSSSASSSPISDSITAKGQPKNKKETIKRTVKLPLDNFGEEPTVVVLDWTKLDTGISSLETLSHQIKFLLSEYRHLAMRQATKQENVLSMNTTGTNTTQGTVVEGIKNTDDGDEIEAIDPPLEVVVLLESPGGSVAEYGLASQHLLRLRNEPGITLTICVDKVAASGGYMLCCTASPGQLFAAPFALLGSIGVIGTQVNIYKLLKNWGVEPIEFRGGKYKAPIGLIGQISKEGRKTTQTMIDQTHRAFKEHVAYARPILKDNIEDIGNGNVWLGSDALDVKLVDAIKTSDEYIEARIRNGSRVFRMVQTVRSGFLMGSRANPLATLESSNTQLTDNVPSESLIKDNLEGLTQKPAPTLAHLQFPRLKSMLSKTFQALT